MQDLVIEPSGHGWSMYDPERIPEGRLTALVGSANDAADLMWWAVGELHRPVRVLPVAELFA